MRIQDYSMIRVRPETKEELRKLGMKGQSWDDVIRQLIQEKANDS